jgi:nucleolar complex protein 2
MGKGTKATKKFAASGQLKKTIQARHKSQAIRKKIQGRKASKGGKPRPTNTNAVVESDEDDEVEEAGPSSSKKGCVPHFSGYCSNS